MPVVVSGRDVSGGWMGIKISITAPVFSFFFQAEDDIRDAQESRGLGDGYKRQPHHLSPKLLNQQ